MRDATCRLERETLYALSVQSGIRGTICFELDQWEWIGVKRQATSCMQAASVEADKLRACPGFLVRLIDLMW